MQRRERKREESKTNEKVIEFEISPVDVSAVKSEEFREGRRVREAQQTHQPDRS